ncbi:MAG: ATP-binding protein [Candidatus Aminicenantes bacterium]|nr:ATP-binding protein [Candidatus Aminicenantes bacterium]
MRSDNPTLLGTVQDVQGASIRVSLNLETISGLSFIKGHGYRIGQVGSFVRIPMGLIDLFGVVSQVGAGAAPVQLSAEQPHGNRWMAVQLVGEGHRRGEFKRGISQYPTIGDEVHLVTEQDLVRIYGRPDEPNFVRVGHLASAESIPALIDINKLITRHCAVVGATGSGKSTTVAGLMASLSDKGMYPSARIIVLDIHGEYAAALRDKATVFRINPNTKNKEEPLFVPYWAMTFDELLSIIFGSLDDANRGAIIEKITDLKWTTLEKKPRAGVSKDNLTVDTPVPFSIHKLWIDLYRLINATHTAPPGSGQSEITEALLLDHNNSPVQPGDPMKVIPPKYMPQTQAAGAQKIYLSGSQLNIRRPLEGLASKLRDPRFDFLFQPGPWLPDVDGVPEKDLDLLLEEWIGGPQPISILDLSGIPVSILTNLIGVLLRIVYDALFWARNLSEGGRERPLLIVLEEAHSYLGQGETGPAAQAVRRIAKEGRKYGIGAMIVSQRPAEVDTTILSQCGTIVAMRLANPTDRAHVTGAVTDNLEGLFSMLPILRVGEAIIAGEAANLPVRTLIDPPAKNRRPDSSDPLVYDSEWPGGWNRNTEKSDYKEVVTVWRKQEPRSPRIFQENKEAEVKND